MINQTSFFTSKLINNIDIDRCNQAIIESIQEEIRKKDPESKVKCTIHLKDRFAFIYGEIIADSTIDASSVAINRINNLFQNYS